MPISIFPSALSTPGNLDDSDTLLAAAYGVRLDVQLTSRAWASINEHASEARCKINRSMKP